MISSKAPKHISLVDIQKKHGLLIPLELRNRIFFSLVALYLGTEYF